MTRKDTRKELRDLMKMISRGGLLKNSTQKFRIVIMILPLIIRN
jgi:hypothetical protein